MNVMKDYDLVRISFSLAARDSLESSLLPIYRAPPHLLSPQTNARQ